MSEENNRDVVDESMKLLQESKEFGKKFFDWFNENVTSDMRLHRLMVSAIKREVSSFEQAIDAYEAAVMIDLQGSGS